MASSQAPDPQAGLDRVAPKLEMIVTGRPGRQERLALCEGFDTGPFVRGRKREDRQDRGTDECYSGLAADRQGFANGGQCLPLASGHPMQFRSKRQSFSLKAACAQLPGQAQRPLDVRPSPGSVGQRMAAEIRRMVRDHLGPPVTDADRRGGRGEGVLKGLG
jgi:hypothetical protein